MNERLYPTRRTSLDPSRLPLSDQRRIFEAERQRQMRQNSWMLAPVLAPAAAVVGLEAAAVLGARAAMGAAPAPLFLRARPNMRPTNGGPVAKLREDGPIGSGPPSRHPSRGAGPLKLKLCKPRYGSIRWWRHTSSEQAHRVRTDRIQGRACGDFNSRSS